MAQSASWYKRGPYDLRRRRRTFFYGSFFLLIFFNIFLFFYVYEGQYNLLRGTAVPQSYLLLYKYWNCSHLFWSAHCRNEDFLQKWRLFAKLFFFPFLFFFSFFFLLFLCNMKDIILILEIRKLCYSFQWLQSNRRAIYKYYMYTYIITIYIIYQLLILYFLLTELLSVVDEQWIFSFIFYSTFLYQTFKLWGKTTAFLSPLIFFSVFFFKIALNTTEILKYMLALRGFLWYLGLPVV